MTEPCQHPFIAIQPDLLIGGQPDLLIGRGDRTIALCINPDCELHAMALRIVDREFIEDVRRVAAREWGRYKSDKESV